MKLPTREEILNLWLTKYHNTTVEEVIKKHPEEVLKSPDWFKLYPCTQEQADEWEKECKEFLSTRFRFTEYYFKRIWPDIILDCAPYVSKSVLKDISQGDIPATIPAP